MNDWDATCREWPQLFKRMGTIISEVEEIIDDIDARCAQAKADECEKTGKKGIVKPVRSQSRDKNQDVLEPLMWPQSEDIIPPRMSSRSECLRIGRPGSDCSQMSR